MKNKICPVCKTEFYSNHNTQKCCSKLCSKKYHKQYIKNYKENNKEIIKEQKKKWDKTYYLKHKKEHRIYAKKYNQIHKKEIKKYMKKYYDTHRNERKKYYLKNKEKINKNRRIYVKIKRRANINFKILLNLRNRIRLALNGICKSKKTKELLGCSIEKLKKYLEKKFKPNMSWSNYGSGKNGKGIIEWQVDHIKPCASFDLSNPEEQRKCFHYTNLQPLWARENLSKGIKYD